MSRQTVKILKRQIGLGAASAGNPPIACEAALALLARSIDFGHGRLAVIRFSIAVQAGASVPASHRAYCEEVVRCSSDPALKYMWRSALVRDATLQ